MNKNTLIPVLVGLGIVGFVWYKNKMKKENMPKSVEEAVSVATEKEKYKDFDDDKYKDKKEPRKYYDPSLPFFLKKINDMIPSISKNKKGEEPKITNFFKKNSLSLSDKKVNEDIERIKRLL